MAQSALINQIRAKELQNRSALYRWLYARYDTLFPVLERPRPPNDKPRPDWLALTNTILESNSWADLNGGEAKAISRNAVRATWLRLKRDKDAEAAFTPAGTAPVPTVAPSPPVPAAAVQTPTVAPLAPAAPVIRSGFDPSTLRPARLKTGWSTEEK